jgi:hypothetical protein
VRRRREQDSATLRLLVPAQPPGLDWVGNPSASVPCAKRQLDSIGQRAAAAGLRLDAAAVGDPDPQAATWDALDWPADEPLLCTCPRRVALLHPFHLEDPARCLTGLTVSRLELPAAPGRRFAPWRLRLGRGHCVLDQPRAV